MFEGLAFEGLGKEIVVLPNVVHSSILSFIYFLFLLLFSSGV